jgi:hypothetical protein
MSTSRVRTRPKISPSCAGLRMTPEEFDALTNFDVRYRYELVRGVDQRQLEFPSVLPHGRMLPGESAVSNTTEASWNRLSREPNSSPPSSRGSPKACRILNKITSEQDFQLFRSAEAVQGVQIEPLSIPPVDVVNGSSKRASLDKTTTEHRPDPLLHHWPNWRPQSRSSLTSGDVSWGATIDRGVAA